ncbi:MAG: single-stranded DNA-binding protein [bacterium]|nr:single-stranded DNA-binding protein [bacterium]
MAKDFNQAIVMGNLTRDPELRSIPSGQSVASFSVATNRSWQDPSGERKDAVEYHDIVAWGKLAELVSNYLSKGRKVLVVGRLQTRSWEAQDGSKRQKTEIIATDINFVDKMSENSTAEQTTDEEIQKGKEDKKTSKKTGKKEEKDVVIEDLGEGEINLDDIPF